MALPDEHKEETVQLVINDLRRLYDEIARNYNNLKARVLGLIAGEVAITSFIFSGNRFAVSKFTPAEKIFFFIGVLLLAVSFGLLLWAVATADWIIPLTTDDSKKMYKKYDSKLDYLEQIKEDYETCIIHGLKKMSIRSKIYNSTLIILSTAIIIMLVIKFTS